jgi:chromosome segregation ATPase
VRLNSFEERVARREEADSELFSQVLTLQTALDQERQTVRRLSRRTREQDQNLDALREAVEDSVVATVDLAQRLEELEEVMSETSESRHSSISPSQVPHSWTAEVEVLRELVEDARRSLNDLQKQVVDSLAQASREREELREAQSDFLKRQAEVEAQNLASSQLLLEARQTLHQQGEAVSQAGRLLEESTVKPQSSFAPEGLLSDLLLRLERLEAEREARPVAISEAGQEGPKPAVFAANGTARGKRVAMFGVRPGFPEPAPRRGVKAGATASAEPKAQ